MEDVAEREAEAERLEAEMAEVCGVLHAATARLVGLIGRVLETQAWQGFGIRFAPAVGGVEVRSLFASGPHVGGHGSASR